MAADLSSCAPDKYAGQEWPVGGHLLLPPVALVRNMQINSIYCGTRQSGPPFAISPPTSRLPAPETQPLHPIATQRRSRITPDDIRQIAFTLVDRHGPRALGYACEAISEMEDKGEAESAAAWRALKSEIEDALSGRIHAASPVQLH